MTFGAARAAAYFGRSAHSASMSLESSGGNNPGHGTFGYCFSQACRLRNCSDWRPIRTTKVCALLAGAYSAPPGSNLTPRISLCRNMRHTARAFAVSTSSQPPVPVSELKAILTPSSGYVGSASFSGTSKTVQPDLVNVSAVSRFRFAASSSPRGHHRYTTLPAYRPSSSSGCPRMCLRCIVWNASSISSLALATRDCSVSSDEDSDVVRSPNAPRRLSAPDWRVSSVLCPACKPLIPLAMSSRSPLRSSVSSHKFSTSPDMLRMSDCSSLILRSKSAFAAIVSRRDVERALSIMSVRSLTRFLISTSATNPEIRISRPSFSMRFRRVSRLPSRISLASVSNEVTDSNTTPAATAHAAQSAQSSHHAREPMAAFTIEEISAANARHRTHEDRRALILGISAVILIARLLWKGRRE